MSHPDFKLRVYFDGQCPLCRREIDHLRRLDQHGALDLQDINTTDFAQRFPHIDPVAADKLLHGEYADGRMIYGLDVSCEAWRLVGKGHWFAFLCWPLLKPVANAGYRLFARHRHRISALFGGKPACDSNCK